MGRQSRPKSKLMGAKLKLIRQHLGLSQTRMLGVVRPGHDPENRAVISQYEKGITDPDYCTLHNYARHARLSTDVLIDDHLDLTLEMIRSPVVKRRPPKFVRDGKPRLLPRPSAGQQSVRGENNHEQPKTESSLAPQPQSDIPTTKEVRAATQDISSKSEQSMPESENEPLVETGETREVEQGGDSLNRQKFPPLLPFGRWSEAELLDPGESDLESFTVALPRCLLDALDDLYVELTAHASRPTRLLVDRRHYYRAFFCAGLLAHYQEQQDSLLTVWKRLLELTETETGKPPQL